MDYKPFLQAEYELASQSLAGSAAACDVLRCQLDSLRYESQLYHACSFFGIPCRRRTIARRSNHVLFKVGWGMGAEDWQIGDRRPITINDIVVEEDSGYVYIGLVVRHGLLCQLRVLGSSRNLGGLLRHYHGGIASLDPARAHFCEPWQTDATFPPHNLLETRAVESLRRISPPVEIERLTDFQEWLLSLDGVTFQRPNRVLPLGVRRAVPATVSEVGEFEQTNQVVVPPELREFWLTTNGASFLGDVIYGTYDSFVGRTKEKVEIALVCRTEYPGQFILADGSGEHLTGNVFLYEVDVETQNTLRTWSSLRDCLDTLLRDARRDSVA